MLVVILAAAGAGAYAYLRRSLPQTSGTVRVEGLSGPVEIVRDADAIPHIFATAKRDALFGLGFAHAQDRLWQMEFQRRIGHGTLSEVFGAATIAQDRFLRTAGFGRTARSAWERLPDDARAQIEAYIAGVNAFLASDPPLPPEFALLRFKPAPWTGPDVLVWVKMMAWDLSANYSHELLRHDLLARVGPQRTAELMPPYPPDGLSILTGPASDHPDAGGERTSDTVNPLPARTADAGNRFDFAQGGWSGAFASALYGDDAVRQTLLGAGRIEALGSNNWVVDGTLTATGKPLLANDPHLGTHIPSTWYLAHLTAGDFDVIGATLPGAPAVAIGRNRFIAWGETNLAADVEDMYLERIDPSGTSAEFRGAQEPIRVIPETIIVKGGAPMHLNVRVTRHGPLVSDALNAANAESKSNPKPPVVEPL